MKEEIRKTKVSFPVIILNPFQFTDPCFQPPPSFYMGEAISEHPDP
jgi:hypothetical protein